MANKSTRTTTRSSKSQSAKDQAKKPVARKATHDNEPRPEIEHDLGEPTDTHLRDEGDLDEETLDPNAPYNKTYGRMPK